MKKVKKVTIKKGWYYTAGNKYKWAPPHSMEGVGINRKLFIDSDEIQVTVITKGGHRDVYILDTKEGLKFIREYKSHKIYRDSLVGFVPRSLMQWTAGQIPKPKVCKHVWEEDEMFASGAIMIIAGNPNCLGEETKLVCKKCGKEDYVPKNITEQFSLLDLFNKGKKKK